MNDLPRIPAEAKEIIKTKEQEKFMNLKKLLMLMLMTPILILLVMILDKI